MQTCNNLQFQIQRSRLALLPALLLAAFVSVVSAEIRQIEKIDIAKVWAGHPVDFAIKTDKDYQCVLQHIWAPKTENRRIIKRQNHENNKKRHELSDF